MENELSAAQNAAYDYRRCARVWQRVDPTLNPYPRRPCHGGDGCRTRPATV